MKNKKVIILTVAAVLISAAVLTAVLTASLSKRNGESEITVSGNTVDTASEGAQSASHTDAQNENTASAQSEKATESTKSSEGTSSSQQNNPIKATENTWHASSVIPFGNAYMLDGIAISPVFSFTGEYVEDGSGDSVKEIAAVRIKNTSDKSIEYMKIIADCSDEKYTFTVMALPVGETVTVFESEKKKFVHNEKIVSASFEHIAYFSSEPTIYPDTFAIYPVDKIITVTNISGVDISGDVYICYKSFDENGFYGGITYRVKIEGIEAGDTIQVPAPHFLLKNSKVVFVSYATNS